MMRALPLVFVALLAVSAVSGELRPQAHTQTKRPARSPVAPDRSCSAANWGILGRVALLGPKQLLPLHLIYRHECPVRACRWVAHFVCSDMPSGSQWLHVQVLRLLLL